MFFSPELLARRDSGFGLLWLAATLGSKSTFKKLPKRSVLTADISQLCGLIAEPSEPLALRVHFLSSIAVPTVYLCFSVKQEIFMSDIASCVTSLKKVVQEMQSIATMGAQLQMAQPTARVSALTLAADPKAAYLIDFDALVADWDEYLNIGEKELLEEEDADDVFDPKAKEKKLNRKPKAPRPVDSENGRADMYTLKEHHDHLLSNSFDLSFNGNVAGMDPSSSQAGGGFAMDDMFLAASDVLDIVDGLGDDLAKELGDGWGIFPDNGNAMELDMPLGNAGDIAMDFDFGPSAPLIQAPRMRSLTEMDLSFPVPPERERQVFSYSFACCPATSFSRMLLSQDLDQDQPQPLLDVTTHNQNQGNRGIKKVKKTRLLLDARTELTDEELKAARAQYLQGQGALRREMVQKRFEKDGSKFLEDMMWSVPRGVQAEALVEFWQENFKVQVEARTGALVIHPSDQPPTKRRKIRELPDTDDAALAQEPGIEIREDLFANDFNMAMDDMNVDLRIGGDYNDGHREEGSTHRHSSEEPGQGRHLSRPQSVFGSNFDIAPHNPPSGSQRSSLFPWDNAGGGSSSAGGFGPMGGSDHINVDRAEIKMRGSSLSRRESSLIPSQVGSAADGLDFSPGSRTNSQAFGEDYVFDVDNPPNDPTAVDSQRSDMNLITLERNSFNFLEYVRMQLQSLPNSVTDLRFDAVVPTATSTRHVAAAAFYHCLVLATKDLLHLKQVEPYGSLSITIS
ncbi:hypothetical protein B0H10DRAFT_2017274 [Mycena sp. CBHHK59/15]|nr:hypothetical protein B0H10DRAFT_2017274 [Mycena sp. CBHHK59/15]